MTMKSSGSKMSYELPLFRASSLSCLIAPLNVASEFPSGVPGSFINITSLRRSSEYCPAAQ
jgi:hypothetical protein